MAVHFFSWMKRNGTKEKSRLNFFDGYIPPLTKASKLATLKQLKLLNVHFVIPLFIKKLMPNIEIQRIASLPSCFAFSQFCHSFIEETPICNVLLNRYVIPQYPYKLQIVIHPCNSGTACCAHNPQRP